MHSRPSHTLGITLYLTGVFLFAVNDALGKWLVADYAVAQLLFLRSAGAGFVLAVLLWRHRPDLRIRGQWLLHIARIAFMAADTFCFYHATKALPLADVMTFYMAAPLIITALSGPLLGERVGGWTWGAVLFGFLGVIIALRPSEAALSTSSLIALAGATMFALAIVSTRKLRGSHWLSLVTWQFAGAGLVGGVLTAGAGEWTSPDALDLCLMFLVGIVSMGCFVAITKAVSITPASTLAPFQYSAIVWAAILGWVVWGDTPTSSIIVGNVIIVISGLVVIYRDAGGGNRAPRPAVELD